MQCYRLYLVPAKMMGFVLLAWLGILLLVRVAAAQNGPEGPGFPNPRLYVMTPSGGRIGSTFEVSLAGIDIEEPQALFFSQPGIKAEPIPPPPPDPKKPMPPAAKHRPPAVTKFKVTIAPDTPVGIHDVRVVNRWGISNPRTSWWAIWRRSSKKSRTTMSPRHSASL